MVLETLEYIKRLRVMKIAFNKEIVNGPYGGGNNVLSLLASFLKRNNVEVCFRLEEDVDIIVVMDVRDSSCCFSLKQIEDFKNKHNVYILHRVNENTIHRKNNSINMDDMIISFNKKFTPDVVVYLSQYLCDYFKDKGLDVSNSVVIGNGSDRSLFRYAENKRKSTDPIKVITHHWSDNMMKGYKTYDLLSDYCFKNPNIARFTFMGNCPKGFLRNAVKISPQPYNKIPFYLSQHDVYVTASLYEPGGCHIVEGMSCGLIPLVAKNTGGCIEYSNGYNLMYDNINGLLKHINHLYANFDFFLEKKNCMASFTYGSEEMCQQYMSVFKGLMNYPDTKDVGAIRSPIFLR